ncbi:hypothetical protein GF343_01985 [Candidatus Woesearchaeota archaeon]|nr:hypothetical protein [Candidatus Woesearchaeota archaeon]
MRSATIFALFLLAAILVAGLYANSIKTYAVRSVNDDCADGLCYGCVLDGVPCTCYSQECVCGEKIVPLDTCVTAG